MMNKTMGKPSAACTAAALMTSVLLVPTMAANASAARSQTQPSAVSIGESKAKEIALQHAGVNASQVPWIIVQQDYEHGLLEYDVKFFAGSTEYDCEIGAVTGAIVDWDADWDYPSLFAGMLPPFSPA